MDDVDITSIITLISNNEIDTDTKIGTMQIVFGISEDDAKLIVNYDTNT